MKQFLIPPNLCDLEKNEEDHFSVHQLIDLESYDADSCAELLNNVLNEVVDSRCFELIAEQNNFDIIYAFMKYFDQMEEAIKARFVHILLCGGRGFVVTSISKQDSSGDSQLLRNALFIYCYFISLMIGKVDVLNESQVDRTPVIAENGRKKKRRVINNGLRWGDNLYDAVEILLFTLRGNIRAFFSLGVPDEMFLQLFYRPCLSLLEHSYNMENPRLIEIVLNTLASLLASYPFILPIIYDFKHVLPIVSSQLVDMIASFDHMASLSARLAAVLFERWNHHYDLVTELLDEISRKDFSESSKTMSFTRNLSHFISICSDLVPFAVLRNLPLLFPLLDREPYALRLAVVQALGLLVEKTSVEKKEEKTVSQRQSQYANVAAKRASILVRRQSMAEVAQESATEQKEEEEKTMDLKTALQVIHSLQQRTRDVNAFVRSAALRTLSTLCEKGFIPLSVYGNLTEAAVDRLKDRAVLVRKNAIGFLVTLLTNNPYEASLDQTSYESKLSEVEAMMNQLSAESEEPREEDQKIKHLHDYYANALHFITLISDAIGSITQLLSSKTESDVIASLQFLPIASGFHLKGVQQGLRRMLLLVWNSSPAILKELINAVKCLYFCVPNETTFLPPNQIAANLIALLQGATLAETTSFGELVPHLIGEGMFTRRNLEGLWGYVVGKDVNHANKCCALYIISMVTAGSASAVSSFSPRILELSKLTHKNDPEMTKYVFMIWASLSATISQDDRHFFMKEISMFLIDGCSTANSSNSSNSEVFEETPADSTEQNNAKSTWYPAANEAIQAAFSLFPRFDLFAEQVIQKIAKNLFSPSNSTRICEGNLCRFFFLLGQFALKLLQFSESIASRAKKSRQKAEEVEISKRNRASKTSDDSLGLVISANDIEDEIFESISNKDIVIQNLLGKFGNPLKEVILNKKGLYGKALQKVALLSFCKFMTVSRKFCEDNLNLLFTLFVRSNDEHARSNLIICIGDLCYRFPNQLEQWTSRIYSVLRDESVLVRTNAISVISHLILNDMIRVKGQISYLVVLMEDPSEHVQQLAKVFFTEWGKRGNNPVYNILPECISALMEMPDVNYEKFARLIKFLIRFVDKEKQQELLVDKLLQRFQLATDVYKWKCLAYCLSCVPVNSQTVEKYLQHKRLLKDALHTKEVADIILQVVGKMKRNAKPGQMAQVEELQAFINECNPMDEEPEPTEPVSDDKEISPSSDDQPPPTTADANKEETPTNINQNKRNQAVESDFFEEDSILESRSKRRVVAFSDSD